MSNTFPTTRAGACKAAGRRKSESHQHGVPSRSHLLLEKGDNFPVLFDLGWPGEHDCVTQAEKNRVSVGRPEREVLYAPDHIQCSDRITGEQFGDGTLAAWTQVDITAAAFSFVCCDTPSIDVPSCGATSLSKSAERENEVRGLLRAHAE
jgi:hypothetical protein